MSVSEEIKKLPRVYIAPGLTVIFTLLAEKLEERLEDAEDTRAWEAMRSVITDLRSLCQGHDPKSMLTELVSDQAGYSDWRFQCKVDAIQKEADERVAAAWEQMGERLRAEVERRFGSWQEKSGGRQICL